MKVKYLKTNYKCPCNADSVEIIFKKPSPYSGTLTSHNCKTCGRITVMRIFKEKLTGSFKVYSRDL